MDAVRNEKLSARHFLALTPASRCPGQHRAETAMRASSFRHGTRDRNGHDGAALVAAAVCGLVACLLALVAAVDVVAPLLHQQLSAAAMEAH
jgi:hypothetical protein